jgi:hypothetical protein
VNITRKRERGKGKPKTKAAENRRNAAIAARSEAILSPTQISYLEINDQDAHE